MHTTCFYVYIRTMVVDLSTNDMDEKNIDTRCWIYYELYRTHDEQKPYNAHYAVIEKLVRVSAHGAFNLVCIVYYPTII